MKTKKQNTELMKDDEILREEAMTDGPMTIAGLVLRPITALSVSWMQRNNIFSDNMDLIWKSAAFAYLHSTPFTEVRAVVNNRAEFTDAVDSWIQKHIVHHNEISEILLTLDSSDNVAITEYAIVGTNGSRGTITATIAGSNVLVTVNPTSNSTVKVTGTLLK
jgi:hypothetical protein